MKKTFISLWLVIGVYLIGLAQTNISAPAAFGSASSNGVTSSYNVPFIIGQPILSSYVPLAECRSGFPYDAQYLQNTFAGGLWSSKGYYADYVLLKWSINSNANSITSFVISRRLLSDANASFQTVATLDPSIMSWQDEYCETGTLYEYKVYAVGITNVLTLNLNYVTAIGFRQPVGTATGRITYAGGTAVQGVSILAETNPSIPTSAAVFNGTSSYCLIDENKTGSLTSGTAFTFQAWLNIGGSNAHKQTIFDKNGITSLYAKSDTVYFAFNNLGAISLPYSSMAGAYFHVTAVLKGKTLLLQLNNGITVLQASKTFTGKQISDIAKGFYIGQDASKTAGFTGMIDEIRIWSVALDSAAIQKDYARMLSGTESGLGAYYQLNEGVGATAYDLTHIGNSYNGNDAILNAVKWTNDIPSQLSIKGITDVNGNYIINNIPYAAQGSSYTFTPMLGVHKFNPTQALRYFSAGNNVSNNVDFTDNSSFTFKGAVYYDKSTFPVEGVNIMIDDNYAFKGRNLVASDANGEFSVDVPIGRHKITLSKQGHVFSQGVFPDKSYPDTLFDFQENIVERIRFYDATTALLTGRVCGGSVQGDKPLGFGLSKANLGYGKIEMNTVKSGIALRSVKTAKGLDSSYTDSLVVPINKNAKNNTVYVIKDNVITIYPDTLTGEYALSLPPEEFVMTKAVAGNLDNPAEQYVFGNSALGTFKLDVNVKDSSSYKSPKDSVTQKYQFNKKYNFVWQETPIIEVTQNGKTMFGDSLLIYNNGSDQKDTVRLWNNAGYYFKNPIFMQSKPYLFTVAVFEEYRNKLRPNAVERIAVTNGAVNVTNEFADDKGEITDTLNDKGVIGYQFLGGEPNLIGDYAQNIALKCTYHQGSDTTAKSIVWDKAFKGIVLGGKSTGSNFVSTGPTNIITILRDPAGSNSYSYLESGKTIVKTQETTGAAMYNMETSATLHLGLETEVGVGIGVVLMNKLDSQADVTLGAKHSSKWIKGRTSEDTYTTTQRWETSADPSYVGAMGDVFVGNSTNIVFGLTNNLTVMRDTTVKDSVAYSITQIDGYRMSPEFNTSFQYTQNHITSYLIPNLISIRNNMFTSKPDIYIPKKSPADPNYYRNTSTRLVGDTVIGDSYNFVVTKQMPTGKPGNTEDSIAVYNRWIQEWQNILAQNEREKVQAIQNNTLYKNQSFDAGTKFENSVLTSAKYSHVDAYSGETFGTIAGATGLKVKGLGFTVSTSHEIGGSYDSSTIDDTTYTTNYGYVLDDENGGDYVSVDVFHDKAGHGPIFRTRGGQTSCPYEGEIFANYYEPAKKHVLGVATMRIEVPEISVANNYQTDVPSTQAAVYDIALRNNSEAGITVRYELAVVDNSNPSGAIIKVDGATLGNGRNYAIPAGSELKKKLTIEKGVADVMKYENIGIVLRSMCQADATDDWENIADTIFVSAEFVPSCTPLTLAAPIDKWTLNAETGNALSARIIDFNKNDGNFVGIYLEYKEASASQWKTLSAFFPDSLSAAYKAYSGTKQTIKGSDIQYVWDTKSNEDRQWDIRAKSVCKDNIVAYSAVASGTKDTKRPQVFGTPQPSDGILSAGEDVMIRFSEPLESGLVGKGNIMVQGVLNGAAIDHSASLQLDGKASYAKADGFSFTGQPVTVEFWMQRDAGSKAGTIFAKGTGDERFEIATFDDKTMLVSIDTSSFNVDLSNIFTPEIPAIGWHHFAVVYDNESKYVVVYGDDKVLLDKQTVNYSPTERGSVYVGCSSLNSNFVQANVQDVRIWNSARNMGDVYANMYTQLSGNEANLLAYWTLDEGKGNLVIDRANAHNLTLKAGWNIAPRGNAITFNGKDQALIIDGKSVVIDATRDAAVEFWFKANKPATRSCLLYNGLNDVFIDGNAPNSFGVFAEADGTLSLLTRGTTSSATSLNVCDNQWHHFAVVLDRLSNIRTYIDGALQAQLDNTLLADLAMPDMSIGAKRQVITATIDSTSMYFAGSIDEVRVWQTARRASLINRYMNSKLVGDEQALLLYYPFEAYVDMMGMKTLSTSLKDKTKAATVADATIIGTPVFTVETPAVKDARPMQTLDASVVVNNDQMLIELPTDMAARYEKRTLEITAYNVQDKNGNRLASPAQWIAYIEKNTVVWDKTSVDVAASGEQTATFTAQVVNKGGSAKSFIIGNLPAWLTASTQSGTVQPNSSSTITFTVISGVNFGAYQHKITLSSDYGYDEVLEVNLSVKAQAPAWTVNPSSYQYTMNVFGKVQIAGIVSTDENDMVGAFVNGECRGVCTLKYLTNFDITEAMLPIFSNTASGEPLELLIWDASEGKTYSKVSPALSFVADSIVGKPDAPVLISCGNSLRTDYALSKGWNWISVNVSNEDAGSVQSLFSKVGSEGDEIKGQKQVFDKYSAKAGWSGSLTAAGGLNAEEMYKLKLTKAGTAQINGTPIDPASAPITIAAGWNWIGYIPQYNMTVEEALAAYGPKQGDLIKGQRSFSMYYDRIGWIGTLNVLEPGKGYMLRSAAASSLKYPSKGMLKNSAIQQDNSIALFGFDAAAYPSNMAIVAALADSVQNISGKVLAAFNGQSCVGIAVATGSRFYLLAAGASAPQNLTFALVDTATGERTPFANQLVYNADAVEGAPDVPYLLYSSLAPETASATATAYVRAYPSPFSNTLTIDGYLPQQSEVSVILTDVLGREALSVSTAQQQGTFSVNLQSIAPSSFASLLPGWYVVQVTTTFGSQRFNVLKN